MNPEDEPYALELRAEQQRRQNLLTQTHMQPLKDYLITMRSDYEDRKIPDFDPCDGGITAKALFLLEAPSGKAVGSNFISRNNPDPTAKNMCHLMNSANIPRRDTLLWNIVPWYIGNEERTKLRSANKEDIKAALYHLPSLLDMLPNLKIIVLVGKHAQSARNYIEELIEERTPKLTIIETHHMSNQVFNRWSHKKTETEQEFVRIAQLLKTL